MSKLLKYRSSFPFKPCTSQNPQPPSTSTHTYKHTYCSSLWVPLWLISYRNTTYTCLTCIAHSVHHNSANMMLIACVYSIWSCSSNWPVSLSCPTVCTSSGLVSCRCCCLVLFCVVCFTFCIFLYTKCIRICYHYNGGEDNTWTYASVTFWVY